jgi:hypothetical protein
MTETGPATLEAVERAPARPQPLVAWQGVAACASVFAYVAVECLAIGYFDGFGDRGLNLGTFPRLLARPTILKGVPLAPVSGLPFAQVVTLAFGIGFGMAGLRRSQSVGRFLTAVPLVYLVWVTLFWYEQLISILLW